MGPIVKSLWLLLLFVVVTAGFVAFFISGILHFEAEDTTKHFMAALIFLLIAGRLDRDVDEHLKKWSAK